MRIPGGWYYAIYRVMYADGKWEESKRLDWPHNADYIFNYHLLQVMVAEPMCRRMQIALYEEPHWSDQEQGAYHDHQYIETWDLSRDAWMERIALKPVQLGTSGWAVEYEGDGNWDLYRIMSDRRNFFNGLLPDMLKAITLERGYCTTCQQLRPMEFAKNTTCGPCARTGHLYRIVDSEADRLWRIANKRYHFLERLNFTVEQVEGMPSWISLHNPPRGWDEEVVLDGSYQAG